MDVEEDVKWRERLPRRKAFIGMYSKEERKRLFLEYFEKETPTGSIQATRTAIFENPYDMTTWYSEKDLYMLFAMIPHQPPQNDVRADFTQRYTRLQPITTAEESATKPSLYAIESVGDYFKHILYERGDLFMKATPLFSVESTDENGRITVKPLENYKLIEIYNEIVAGYFLNELVYGYTNVLSIHFMTIVDWFVAMRDSVDSNLSVLQPYHQMIVTERLDVSLYDLITQTGITLDNLRAILFEVFHALEVAWHTNQYTHNDLHPGNVMVRMIDEGTPLRDRNFIYRRLDDPHWYKIDKAHLNNMLAKIIDFGRNRLFAPREANHVHGSEEKHSHSYLIHCDMDDLGYGGERPNRQIDVRLLLMRVLVIWSKHGPEEGKKEFYDFCDRVIDFKRINEIVANYYKGKYPHDDHINERGLTAEYINARQNIRAANYYKCRNVGALLDITGAYDQHGVLHKGVFFYQLDNEQEALGSNTVTDVLNDAFFQTYRLPSIVEDIALDTNDIYDKLDDTVVVSFITHPTEADMTLDASTTGTTTTSLRCCVCNATRTSHIAGDDAFCGKACYEFKYLFHSKTVYR